MPLSSESVSSGRRECFFCSKKTGHYYRCTHFADPRERLSVCIICLDKQVQCFCGRSIEAQDVRLVEPRTHEKVVWLLQKLEERMAALERCPVEDQPQAEVDKLPEVDQSAMQETTDQEQMAPSLRRLRHPIRRRHMGAWRIYAFHPEDEVLMKSKSKVPPGCRDLEIAGESPADEVPKLEAPSCYFLINDDKRMLFQAGTKSGRHRLAKIVLGFFDLEWRCEDLEEDHWVETKVRL